MKLGMTAGRNVGLDQERARLSAKAGPESRVSGQEARHTKRPFHASGLGADGGDLGAGGRGGGRRPTSKRRLGRLAPGRRPSGRKGKAVALPQGEVEGFGFVLASAEGLRDGFREVPR